MGAYDLVYALKGVEDVLRGTSTATVPTSAGGTRTINPLSGTFLDKDYDFTGSGDYTFTGAFAATGDVELAGAGGKTLTVGNATDADNALVALFYGLAQFEGDILCKGNFTIPSGKDLSADDAAFVGDVSVGGTFTAASYSGAVTASGAWLHSGQLRSTAATLLADGVGATLQVGASGTSDATAVGTYYGKHTFEGNAVFNGSVTMSGTFAPSTVSSPLVEAVVCEVDGVAGSQALRTSTFYASGAAQIDGLLTADGGIEIDGHAFGYNAGLSQFTLDTGLYVAGDLTVTGSINFASSATSLTLADYINFGTSAEWRMTGQSLLTIPATIDISGKNLIYINDSTGSGTTISAVISGGTSKLVMFYNNGSDYPVFAAGIMQSGGSFTLATGKGCILFWDEAKGKFLEIAKI